MSSISLQLTRRVWFRQVSSMVVLPLTILAPDKLLAGNAKAVGWLPSLEDLEPRWSQVSVGMNPDQVTLLMGGTPAAQEQSEWIGLRVEELVWRDLRTNYRARFIANKLVTKSMVRSPGNLVGQQTQEPNPVQVT